MTCSIFNKYVTFQHFIHIQQESVGHMACMVLTIKAKNFTYFIKKCTLTLSFLVRVQTHLALALSPRV